MSAVAAVIIPAHDEEERIGTSLRSLLTGVEPGALEVVVVCNGCTDATAAVATEVPGVEVIELEEASKVAALRAGDARASTFPRIYLDADVELAGPAAVALAHALETTEPRVAGVRAEVDLSTSTRPVCWFYGFRQRLTVFQDGVIGAGVYAMNAAGRARFATWPDVLGDDQFVLRLFERDERVTLEEYRSRVGAPPDLGSLVRRGVRVRRGNSALDHGAAGAPSTAPSTGVVAALRSCLLQPASWPHLATWVVVSAWVRLIAQIGTVEGDWVSAGGRRVPLDRGRFGEGAQRVPVPTEQVRDREPFSATTEAV